MRTKFYLFLYAFIGFSAIISATQPAWDHTLDLHAIEARLQNQKIVQLIPMRDYLASQHINIQFTHEVYLAILADGLKAVFKPESTLKSSYAEVAAYRASAWLGLRLVPPTVLKKYKNQQGSLQFFVEFESRATQTSIAALNPKDKSDMHLFCFIFGKSGTHTGNRLVAVHNNRAYIALIDNASIRFLQQVHYGDFPFIYKGRSRNKSNKLTSNSFPFNEQKTFSHGTLKELKTILGEYMSDRRIEDLWNKKRPITYCFWNNTLWIKREQKTGPNYTDVYYKSTLDQYKKLTKAVLEKLWSEWLHTDPQHVRQLIHLTLERRNQVLKAAQGIQLF